jgi:AcrR family transcriptional regulator
MARTKDQAARRRQLVSAAQRAVLARGLAEVRLRDIAEEAGITPSAVLYYYEEIEHLFVEVYERGAERFCTRRDSAVEQVADRCERMRIGIRLGIPNGPDDEICRLLYEFQSYRIHNTAYSSIISGLFERQADTFFAILDSGAAMGVFQLTHPPRLIARNIIALEDGYGIHVLRGRMTPADAVHAIITYASAVTGRDLTVDTG